MTRNYEDMLNQGLQIGRLTGELAESQGKAATAGIRAVDNEMKARSAKKALEKEQEVIKKLREELAEKEASILEWMHTNESFKRQAKRYAKDLGIPDEKRIKELQEIIIDLAEEDSSFKSTRVLVKARKYLEEKATK
jgi:hypothetical protein